MGYLFFRGKRDEQDEFEWNIFMWPRILTLAMAHGWEPIGTKKELCGKGMSILTMQSLDDLGNRLTSDIQIAKDCEWLNKPFPEDSLPECTREYGWVCSILNPEGWNGGYLSNDWQSVKGEDALNLADALEFALKNSEDLDADIESNLGTAIVDQEKELCLLVGKALPEEHVWDGRGIFSLNNEEAKRIIWNFVDFCRRGSFFII